MAEDFTKEALNIRQHLANFETELSLKAKAHKILILGDYGKNLPMLEQIRIKLTDGGYPAFLLKDIKNGIDVTDYDAAVLLTQNCDLILLLDGNSIGTGVECGLIMKSKELQEKTLFLTSQSFDALCDTANPYFYYPIYEYHNNMSEDIISKSIGMVKRETYRRAKIYIELQKSMQI